MPKRILVFALLLVFLLPLSMTSAQNAPRVTLAVIPGFDGRFRDDMWAPLLIRAANDGADVSGRLVVRPETSGNIVNNTYSTPVNLPSGSRQNVLLYIVPSAMGSNLRVELLDSSDTVITSQAATMRSLQPQDQLYVVITSAANGSVDMSGASISGNNAFQANWGVENLPEVSAVLSAVDMLLITDADTALISTRQQQALADWIIGGGHLIVTGGTAWQSTAAGLLDLLPMNPTGSTTVDNLTALADWTGRPDIRRNAFEEAQQGEDPEAAQELPPELAESTVIATGTTTDDAEVLVVGQGGAPLVSRRQYGAGYIDYLAADPNAAPLRNWDGLTNLWFSLRTSVEPRPSWGNGFLQWQYATNAVQIIPGFNLLPSTAALCLFLIAYIALVGPANYLILSRLNRREWAWLTMPILIIAFSALAWLTGFNLRGNEVTLNRISVIQSFPDAPRARVDELTGLLSPRRANYSLAMLDGSALQTIPQTNVITGGGPFTSSNEVIADIQQTDTFRAADVPVDASFIAGFYTRGMIERPDVGGRATIFFDGSGQRSTVVRGAVTNSTDFTLEDAVLLTRGGVERIGDLTPGETQDFEIDISPELAPAASVPDRTTLTTNPYSYYGYYGGSIPYNPERTILEILGEDVYNTTTPYGGYGYYGGPYYGGGTPPSLSEPEVEENNRRRAFLSSFMIDLFGITGRGDEVYLIGWSSRAVLPIELQGAGSRSQDATLYVIKLETERPSASGSVTITPDRFTWVTRSRLNTNVTTPFNISLYSSGEVVFRFTPLPDARLSDVNRMILRLESANYGASEIPIEIWNWRTGQWDEYKLNTMTYTFTDPADYVGPENAVEIRLSSVDAGLTMNIGAITIEQRGRF